MLFTVSNFGDQGWYADDTRSPNGTDLVGTNYTHAGKPGQTATTTDDTQIANQIQFVGDAPDNVGALKLSFGANPGGGKASLSTINTDDGFAKGNWSSGFFANMSMYRVTNTNTTIRIGVQSTKWADSQTSSGTPFIASRTGESVWDLQLVYTGAGITTSSWQTAKITDTIGTWKLSSQVW